MGKAGPKGDVGPAGEKGEVGETGSCSCVVPEERFDEMQIIQQNMTNALQKIIEKEEEMTQTIQTLQHQMSEKEEEIQTLQQKVSVWTQYEARLTCDHDGGMMYGGKCFFLKRAATRSRSFAAAKRVCEDTHPGSQLASITSSELFNALESFIRSQIDVTYTEMWTSGRYDPIAGTGNIQWTDGTTTTGWRWYPSYPRNGKKWASQTHIFLTVWKNPAYADGFFTDDNSRAAFESLCSY